MKHEDTNPEVVIIEKEEYDELKRVYKAAELFAKYNQFEAYHETSCIYYMHLMAQFYKEYVGGYKKTEEMEK